MHARQQAPQSRIGGLVPFPPPLSYLHRPPPAPPCCVAVCRRRPRQVPHGKLLPEYLQAYRARARS